MYENNFPNKRFRITLDFLKQFISNNDRILDLGTTNPFSDILKKEGFNITNTEGEDLDLDTTIVKKDDVKPSIGKQVLSKKTSENMRRILRLVVEKGTGKNASADGYLVGGKTGTADKQSSTGAYAKSSRLSSFVGAFPIHKPKFVVLVMVDEPKGNKSSFGYATGG